MKKSALRILSAALISCIAFTSCTALPEKSIIPSKAEAIQSKFDKLMDEFAEESFSEMPEIDYHYIFENPEDYGLKYKNYNILNYDAIDMTDEEKQEKIEDCEENLQKLLSFDKDYLTKSQKALFENYKYEFETLIEYGVIEDYSSLLAPMSGFISNMGSSMFYEYRFAKEKDIEDYLKFAQDIPTALRTVLWHTQEQIAENITPSDSVLEKNVEMLRDYANETESPFIEGFDQKIDGADFLTDEQKASYKERNLTLLKEKIFPEFTQAADTLNGWIGKLKAPKNLTELEGGDKYYEYLVEMYTCTEMTPDKLFKYLEKNLNLCIDKLHLIDQKDINDFYEGNYNLSVSTTDDILLLAQKKTNEICPDFKDPGCVLTELPDSLCVDGVLAYYMNPQIDSNALNVARINKIALGGADTINILATVSHETYPGHLYQTNFQIQNNPHIADSCLSYVAYNEGWADYASTFALKWAGLSQKMVDIYMLDYEIGQIMTAMIDIGVNYKGWDVAKITKFTNKYLNFGYDEYSRSYYEFVTEDPGVILSYPVGYLKLQDIRQEVMDMEGSNYNEYNFIFAFLKAGHGPFELVRKRVLNYFY
ncbi:MAG: DUF885 family protein [Oscillospiraceae bacterium]